LLAATSLQQERSTWADPRAGLGVVMTRRSLPPTGNRVPDVSPVASPLKWGKTLWEMFRLMHVYYTILIVSRICDCRRGLDSWLNLLTTYTLVLAIEWNNFTGQIQVWILRATKTNKKFTVLIEHKHLTNCSQNIAIKPSWATSVSPSLHIL
jgi:hypothetical protein